MKKLSGEQMDKSWSVIDIFSSIMRDSYQQLPQDWTVEAFISTFESEFQTNVFASESFVKSSKSILLQFSEFLQYKDFNQTEEIQDFLLEQIK